MLPWEQHSRGIMYLVLPRLFLGEVYILLTHIDSHFAVGSCVVSPSINVL